MADDSLFLDAPPEEILCDTVTFTVVTTVTFPSVTFPTMFFSDR